MNFILVVRLYVMDILMKNKNKLSFVEINKRRFYKTNDVVDNVEDIFFIKGRNDSVVKILGNRVELFEIDNQIRKVHLVKNCYVFLKEINDYEKYIFAVVEGTGVKEQNILNKLRKYLPNYMIPRQVKILKKFPVNKNNKIDRPKLKKFFDN